VEAAKVLNDKEADVNGLISLASKHLNLEKELLTKVI
jgi:hypothetical protein